MLIANWQNARFLTLFLSHTHMHAHARAHTHRKSIENEISQRIKQFGLNFYLTFPKKI